MCVREMMTLNDEAGMMICDVNNSNYTQKKKVSVSEYFRANILFCNVWIWRTWVKIYILSPFSCISSNNIVIFDK